MMSDLVVGFFSALSGFARLHRIQGPEETRQPEKGVGSPGSFGTSSKLALISENRMRVCCLFEVSSLALVP